MGVKIDRGSVLEFKELYSKLQAEKNKCGEVKTKGVNFDSFGELMGGLRDSLTREIKIMITDIAFNFDDN